MKSTNLFGIAIAILFAGLLQVSAQTESCIIKLKDANTSFEQSDYDGTIKILKQALAECDLDKAEKIQANKLLILSYLKIDNLEEADKTAAAIMKIDPNFKPDKFRDDPKLSALFEKYKPSPVLKLGFSAGVNIASADAVNTFSIVHNNESAPGSYNSLSGFQLGLSAEYRAYKNLWLQLEGKFRQSSYEHILDSVENATINYSEVLSYIDFPVSLKYYFTDNTLVPFVEAGACFSILTDALSTTVRGDQNDLVNRTDYRNSFMTGIMGGAGLMYKRNRISLYANVRYTYYGQFVNKEDTRYADAVNVFKYYYIDDDFRLHNWQLNVGIQYTLLYKNLIVGK